MKATITSTFHVLIPFISRRGEASALLHAVLFLAVLISLLVLLFIALGSVPRNSKKKSTWLLLYSNYSQTNLNGGAYSDARPQSSMRFFVGACSWIIQQQQRSSRSCIDFQTPERLVVARFRFAKDRWRIASG